MTVLKTLFWNTYKKPLVEEVSLMTKETDSNLIILIENTSDNDYLIENLEKYTGDKFFLIESLVFNKAKIFTSINNLKITEKFGHGRYGIYELAISGYKNILLGVVHLPSKQNWGSTLDHFGFCVELKSDILNTELNSGIESTILLGDFNMNPFESGMVNSGALHNTSSREIALTGSRNYQNKSFKYFYNPMWNFFGEFSKGKAQGTHYYNTYSPTNYHWNLYDQVLLRPELIDSFDEEKLDILTTVGAKKLTKTIKGITRVDKDISDHLPIKFELSLKKEIKNEESVA
nr:hypothetical protein [Allomuricauda sp.]